MRSKGEEVANCSREQLKLQEAQMGYENEEDIGMAAEEQAVAFGGNETTGGG